MCDERAYEDLRTQLHAAQEALALAKSIILSDERMSETAATKIQEVLDALALSVALSDRTPRILYEKRKRRST